MKRTERGEQIALIHKCRLFAGRYPALRTIYHIPNGEKRDGRDGAILQAMGVRPGMPDLHLPVSGDGYASLYIEMKTTTGRLSKVQQEVHDDLRAGGNHVVVCRSAEEAWRMIAIHLGIEKQSEGSARD